EQLLPGLRETAHQLFRAVDGEAQVLVLRSALEYDELEVLILAHGAAQKADLVARLALEVQDLLALVAHVDERVLRVVLEDQLTILRRDAKAEAARTGVVRGEVHAHGRRLGAGRQLDFLRADDLAAILDEHRHLATRIARVRDDEVDDERRALERRARRGDTAQLDVALEPLSANADRVHWHARSLEREQRLGERLAGVVGAVAHDDEARQRHGRQLLARAVERGRDHRACARVRQSGRVLETLHRIREAEPAQLEAVGQVAHELALRRERRLYERRARLSAIIRDAHAARVVQQDAHVVLLRYDRGQHQLRTEQTE